MCGRRDELTKSLRGDLFASSLMACRHFSGMNDGMVASGCIAACCRSSGGGTLVVYQGPRPQRMEDGIDVLQVRAFVEALQSGSQW